MRVIQIHLQQENERYLSKFYVEFNISSIPFIPNWIPVGDMYNSFTEAEQFIEDFTKRLVNL